LQWFYGDTGWLRYFARLIRESYWTITRGLGPQQDGSP
jgi:hypothetical protein